MWMRQAMTNIDTVIPPLDIDTYIPRTYVRCGNWITYDFEAATVVLWRLFASDPRSDASKVL